MYGLACGHQFHRFCLGEWVYGGDALGNERCPLCRAGIFGGNNGRDTGGGGEDEWIDEGYVSDDGARQYEGRVAWSAGF